MIISKKVDEANKSGQKVIKTWSRRSVILPEFVIIIRGHNVIHTDFVFLNMVSTTGIF